MALAAAGCSSIENTYDRLVGSTVGQGEQGFVKGFLGGVAVDEPQAARAARAILSSGGTAADAAVAAAFTLAVTLPSRAGLGGGGACLAHAPEGGTGPEAFVFMPLPGGGSGPGIDRPAGVPLMARGLYAMHARYGRFPFEQLIAEPERLARFGAPVSRALARDLAVVAGPLGGDPATANIFLPGGRPPAEGDILTQPELAGTIGQLRVSGVGDLYQGALARRLAEASVLAGGGITAEALRGALPSITTALTVPIDRGDAVAFLPPPADGGLSAAAAFLALRANPSDFATANARAMGAGAAFRSGRLGSDFRTALANPPPGSMPPLPASTGFTVMDLEGNSVACVLSMNNLFGTGRVAPGTGLLLSASPASMPPPLLAAAIVYNTNINAFRIAMTGTGQDGAALALAAGLQQTIAANRLLPNPVPEPGRANAVWCGRYRPGPSSACAWQVDPRESGLAVGSF